MTEFHYFKSVKGVARRYGTDTFIGATRGPKGFTVNREVIVRIPHQEFREFRKSYNNLVRRGSLKRCTIEQYDAYETKRKDDAAALRDKAAAAKKAAADEAVKAVEEQASEPTADAAQATAADTNNDESGPAAE